ncbi:MAG: DUF4430 domain-containing protein [Gaiellaceae bacterium]
MKRVALALLLALVLAGCGGVREHGAATLWVTRDRGAQIVFSGRVPAGLSAMQALERKVKVSTRYGGRFVQSIDGVQGSLSGQRDWFYFVNGVEADSGATAVRLRPGDVEWWDYRSWRGGAMTVPVVLGAFPEPFLHGFEGVPAGSTAVIANGVPRSLAARIAAEVHGTVSPKRPRASSIVIGGVPAGTPRIHRTAHGVLLELGAGAARRLAADPAAFRYRYGSTT